MKSTFDQAASRRAMPASRPTCPRLLASSLRIFAALVLALGLAPTVHAALPAGDDPDLDQMSVRELMRLDTAFALQQSRDRFQKGDGSSQAAHRRSSIAHSGALELVAIYGVGKKLLAEVIIGTKPHVYVRGQALPVGARASAAVYLLRGISGSCIHLERQDETHTLCLPMSVGTAR